MKRILALVGMPGAGKTEAAEYLLKKGFPYVRFGQFVEDGVKKLGLAANQENERRVREQLRKEKGMAAMAILAKPKIKELFKNRDAVVIDGVYSWEEYVLLKEEFPGLILIHIFAEPSKRYERLAKRSIRGLSLKAYERDVAELEKLNKGGPIAIADYLIENNEDNITEFYRKIDQLLTKIGIKNDSN